MHQVTYLPEMFISFDQQKIEVLWNLLNLKSTSIATMQKTAGVEPRNWLSKER